MRSNRRQDTETGTDVWLTWTILLAIVLTAAAIRCRLLDVPLERDEGEYAYAGQLILDGVPPYRDVYNMKLPGIYAAYAAVLAVFGESLRDIHLGLLVVNGVTILLVFVLATQLVDAFTGLVAAASFSLMSLWPAVQGVFANAEHFVLPPALAGMIVLRWALAANRKLLLALSGLLLGSALVVKQHGVAFVALGGVYLLVVLLNDPERTWREKFQSCLWFALTAAAPYLLTCLIMMAAGVFDNFWFWTFTYARAYVSQIPISDAPANLLNQVDNLVLSGPLLWVLAIVGATALGWHPDVRRGVSFLVPLAVFSFLSVCPGFYFRPHYFVLSLPALAVFAAIGARSVATLLTPPIPPQLARIFAALLVICCLADSTLRQRRYLFQWTPEQVSLYNYGTRLFPDSLAIAEDIRELTSKSDRIAVLGSEPQIPFYADRRSATGYIYMYPLMEPHPFALDMQRAMIREVEEQEPKVIVYVIAFHSWGRQPNAHDEIFRWFQRYRRHYRLAVVYDSRAPMHAG